MHLPRLNLKLFRDYKQLIYGFAVAITIPLLVVLNTYYLVSSMQKNMDYELQKKSLAVTQSLNAYLMDSFYSQKDMQGKIEEFGKLTDEVKKISILKKEEDKLFVYASLDKSEIEKEVEKTDRTLFMLAYYEDTPVARPMVADRSVQIAGKTIQDGERFFSVNVPLKNQKGETIYLANVLVSRADIDALTSKTLVTSGSILVVSIIVIILLFFSNSRLFEYSILFRKLQEVDQMKDDFISVASHELRTPLTVIRGYVDLLKDVKTSKALKEKDKKEIYDNIFESTQRLNELVEDLLDVSRIEQGRQKFEMVEVDMKESLTHIVEGFKLTAKNKGLKLIESFQAESAFSLLDKDKFNQVMVNLIGNSIKYTLKGEVEIILSQEERMNKIVIRDTGIGMNEEERKSLFTKFYRIKNDQTKDISGTGLGLWITKQLVESMKGKIMVDSIKDVGSQFSVYFPRVDKEKGE